MRDHLRPDRAAGPPPPARAAHATHTARVILLGVAAAALLALPGCSSLDATADTKMASDQVASRTETETGWTLPWHERAEHWDGQSNLSADAAVRVALQNNRELRREVETIVAARADVAQAHLLPNPIVNLAIGFPTDGLGGTPLGVGLIQQLAWLWRRPAAIESADAALRARILSVSDEALRLVAATRDAHAAVVYAERAATLQRENIDLIAKTVDLLEVRFSVGEASRLDLNRFKLDLHRARTRLADRESQLATSRRTLLEIMARAGESDAWTTDDGVPEAATATGGLSEDDVIHLARTQRLDVAAADASLGGRSAQLELANLGRLPDVSAGAEYSRNFSDRPAVFPTLQVTPKLFDDNSARIARAASEYRQQEIETDRVRQGAIAESRRAWIVLRAQEDVVTAFERDILVLAEQNLRLAHEAFDAGETDLTVLLETQRQLNDARLEFTDRQRAATRQLIELERAAGGSLASPAPGGAALTSSLHFGPHGDVAGETMP